METIKVNMNPNPLDVQTIHASQNDGEARQWEFELHNNGELIDTSEITEQLFFKAYKGGTEQILPENTSTPTTSPFKGDIKYPQGLLSDQEFLYRESPTEEDGLAKITDIKGNTIVWNQLAENGDFSTSSGWTGQFATVTISNNVASVRQDRAGDYVALRKSNLQGLTGHKYLVVADVKSAKKTAIAFYLSNAYSSAYDIQANTRTVVHAIITVSNANDSGFNVYTNRKVELAEGDVVEFYHVMLFDLTQMGLDITASDFTSLFPLSYYAYNQGTLLSFMGNGIKTVGFNQWDEEWEIGGLNASTGALWNTTDRIRSKNFIDIKPSTSYFIHYPTSGFSVNYCFYDGDKNFISSGTNVNTVITTPTNARYMKFATYTQYGTTYNHDICINISDPSKNGTYEPYTESVLSLPISTYFPTGMKSAGTVYDELTETKAITRIGTVDMGTLSWNHNSTYEFFYVELINAQPFTEALQKTLVCPIYETGTTVNSASQMANIDNKTIRGRRGVATTQIYVKDTSYSSATDLVNALKGIPLYYELSTPTETSFTTASLVTENAEIPLSNDDGVLIGKCTEQLSENPGFIDAKIKLTDADGECYSNKIQLHIERSPQ